VADPAPPPPRPPWHVGIDVGGTFTDVVLIDAAGAVRSVKSPSRPDDPAAGVLEALARTAAEIGGDLGALLAHTALLVHGSTVATNTILEHTGARVGLLCTEGFRDALEIRRGIRKNPWDHRTPYPEVLVPRFLRLPVRERIDRHGAVHTPLDPASVAAALAEFGRERVEAVAICFLNGYLNPVHEAAAAAEVRAARPGLWVSVSSEIAPVAGEYERVSTTVIDAYVAPRLNAYLRDLARRLAELGLATPLLLVKNNGGTASVDEIGRTPAALTLSGPAAVVGALRHYAEALGRDDLISIEIGGTSCDVVLMSEGAVPVTDSLAIGGYDTLMPSVEVHTVGAGGGAIAGVDRAGVLFAGPRGAGARPGPAAYGQGGVDPTVTDAEIVLGRLRSGLYAGGVLALDADLAARAVRDKVAAPLGIPLDQAAAGIIQVAEQRMLHAVQTMSIQRGFDPRRFTLVAGGGAGGLHGVSVARALGCPAVYVPRLAGVLCALGMLHADVRHDYVRSHLAELATVDRAALEARFVALKDEARHALGRDGFAAAAMRFERALDLRYRNQQWDVRVALDGDGRFDADRVRAAFEDSYDRLYGHRQPESVVEIVKIRVTGMARPPVPPPALPAPSARAPVPREERRVWLDATNGWRTVPIHAGPALAPGHRIAGPLVVEERTTTILVGVGDTLVIDRAGNYLVHLGTGSAA